MSAQTRTTPSHSYRFVAIAGAAALVLAALAGCTTTSAPPPGASSGSAQSPTALQKVNWVATSISDSSGKLQPVVAGSKVTAFFSATDITGSGGVNHYGATYKTASPNGITITMGPATLIAGPQDLMTQESAFFADMGKAATYVVTAEKLQLNDSSGKALVIFAAGKPLALTGQTWYCTGYNNGKQAVVSLEASSEITADFTTDGHLAGFGGVNHYNASYETSGTGGLKIGPIAATKVAGPENLMTQETQYFSALGNVAGYEIDGDTLVLWGAGNAGRQAEYTSQKP